VQSTSTNIIHLKSAMLQRLHTVAHIHNQSYLECNSRSSLEIVDTLFVPHTKGLQNVQPTLHVVAGDAKSIPGLRIDSVHVVCPVSQIQCLSSQTRRLSLASTATESHERSVLQRSVAQHSQQNVERSSFHAP